ncbi:FlgD immunoglobulin-like domain containing protein [Melioribacter sp. OK-6-Me]|uniref:FlgD immunoglobulin-like domain containing protein n=1 Tax=Melioribacter sp. OK-6-Me TaxID=3423433 RepID=UPI003ED961D9
MNFRNIINKLGLLLVLLTFAATTAFAQNTYYVSNTNGNDITGNGSSTTPYQTIAKALSVAADGDFIRIDADTYNEANVNVTKAVHFVAQTFNALNTVTITNGMTINPGSGKNVYLGTTADGSQKFNLGTGANALVLTSGTLNITGANVIIGSGGTITRSAGAITETPTTTNVNVTYTSTSNTVAGPELPSNLGTGTLTVNLGAAATTLTVNGNLALSSGQIIVTQGSPTFNGTVSFTSDATGTDAIVNNGAGTVTFAVQLLGAEVTSGAPTPIRTINNVSTGKIVLTGGVGTTGFDFGLTNGSTGTIEVGAGTYSGPINNNAGGTINLLTSATFSNATVSNNNAASVIKLNGYQLTLSGTTTLTNAGNIISSAASTVGSGMLNISGTVTANGGGELPNVTIASGGKLTLGANTSVYGSLTLASNVAGALTDNGNTLTIYGSQFNRTDNTPNNVAATGTLVFAGNLTQSFNPGASLVLNNLTVNKGASTVVSLAASIAVAGNLTITNGTLDVGNYNLNLTGASVFDNSGNAYSTTGVGYVAFIGASGTVQGTGTFGNILVNLSNAANKVATGSSVTISGILYINQGDFDIAAAGHTVTFNNALVANPTVKINTTTANSAALTNTGGGTLTYSTNVNLYYFGADDYTAGPEWSGTPTKINDVTIAVASGKTVTGHNGASTINGTLTVNSGTTLAQGANTYTLAGDGKTHSVKGTVSGGTLEVTGNGSSVNGSTASGDAATVNNLTFEPAANSATFTSSDLKSIANLTLQGTSTKTGAVATVTMNSTNSTLSGNLVVGNATVGPTASVTIAGGTTSTFSGNLTLTNGTLTLTRGGASTVIGGTVTLTAGTLTLGSNVQVTGATTQVAGNINAGGFKYIQLGSAASPDYNRTGTGTFTNGTLELNSTAAAIDLTPGASFTVPNLSSVGTANGVTINAGMTVSNSLLIDNAATFAQTGTLTVTGNSVTVESDAGAFTTGALELKGNAANVLLKQNYTIPTLTINSTGTVQVNSDNSTAKTLTVSTAFTNTAGTLAMGINHLVVNGTFTFTAGAITQTTGMLTWSNAGVTIPSSGFSIDNLTVNIAVNTGANKFTVNKNLVLKAALTTTNDNDLTLGDGILIERQANAATLAKLPAFGANTDVKYTTYTGGADIVTGKELPATVRNLTIASSDATANNADGFEVILNANVTVAGTLSLNDKLDAVTNNKTVTMADGSTLELKINGTVALDKDLVKAGSMALIYNGATATSTRELGAVTSGSYAPYAGNVTFKSNVTLDNKITLNGDLTFDGGNFDINGKDVNIGGNVTQTSNGGIFTATTAAFLNFTGANNTTLALNGTWAVPGNIKFRMNKSSNEATLTFSGGDLDFTASVLYFQNGVLVTGSKNVILRHDDNGSQPTQGFDRSGVTGTNASHVVGNVKKLIDATGTVHGGTPAIALTRVEFPVGTAPSSTPYYKPLAFQFTSIPTSNFTLTVSEAEVSPKGTNGFPITSGNLTITNYPDFYWLVKSDLTLQPSVTYDIEARAEGYTEFQTDGIQNIRFVRRFDGNVNNQWIAQGGTSYDNYTDGTTPVVIVRNATGAISTVGAIFTYSQLNKAPKIVASSNNIAVNEGDTVSVTWTVTDPDIGQTPSAAIVQKPAAAVYNASAKSLTWITGYTDAGSHTIILSATDGTLTTYDTVAVTVANVNRGPKFTESGAVVLADTTIKSSETLSFTYNAVDVDGDPVTYTLLPITPAFSGTATISSTLGTLTFSPVFADASKTFTVSVVATDGTASDTTTAMVTVDYPVEKGDVGGDGNIASDDASVILKYVVGLDTLDAQGMYAADVNNDGVIGAYDAAWILYYVVNGEFPTAKVSAAMGTVEFGKAVNEEGVLSIPVTLMKAQGILSVSAEIELGNQVEFKNVTPRLPEGWVMFSNFENGVLKLALAGTTPLTDGDVALIGVALKDKESAVNLTASAKLNDQIGGQMSVKVKEIPTEFTVSQNYPNPFNPTTNIKYGIPQDAKVSLVIYNMLGQVVKTLVDQEQEAGYYTVRWDGTNDFGSKVSSGIYIYRITAGKYTSTMKMNLLK